MYVALTRAREYVIVLYTGNEGLVPQLVHCQELYRQNFARIIQEELLAGQVERA